GDRRLAAPGIERAGGDEGGRGGPADAGKAMDDERRLAIPAAGEVDELHRMLLRRRRQALLRRPDVVPLEHAVIRQAAAGRPLDGIDEQGDDMTGADLGNRVVQPGERADVNHPVCGPWREASVLGTADFRLPELSNDSTYHARHEAWNEDTAQR